MAVEIEHEVAEAVTDAVIVVEEEAERELVATLGPEWPRILARVAVVLALLGLLW